MSENSPFSFTLIYVMKKRKLCGITFTGLDEYTDLVRAKQIAESSHVPVEYGILLSKKWAENGTRYLNPNLFLTLLGQDFRLAAHFCGSIAREAVTKGNWESGMSLVGEKFNELFQRVQLNISGYGLQKIDLGRIPVKEVIIQQKGANDCDAFLSVLSDPRVTVLLDPSGGQGIAATDEPLNLPVKVGYAGGFSPENVIQRILVLEQSPVVGQFWIDMESGVRTDDKFDLDKVEDVVKLINKYDEEDRI